MKTIPILLLAATLSVGLLAANSANAALIVGDVYDTDSNIYWLTDANFAKTSGYDADGLMTWSQAQGWINSLNAENGGHGHNGHNDWRLPTSDTCNTHPCTGSEMGHLFYTELGGVYIQSITATHNTNYYLFQNIQTDRSYWSGTEYTPNNNYAWNFSMASGFQTQSGDKNTGMYAFAVRPNSVATDPCATVPVPAAAWLLGSGLLGLVGVARRKAA